MTSLVALTAATMMVFAMTDTTTKPVERYLVSAAEAQKPESIIKLFEALTGRTATAQDVADVNRVLEIHAHPPHPMQPAADRIEAFLKEKLSQNADDPEDPES